MTGQNSVESFSENLRQDVLALAELEEQDLMLADSFTQTVFEMLSDAGEFEDPLVCYHRARGMEISGYGVDEDEGRVDLFLSIHTNATPPATVTRQQVDVAFRRLRSFLAWCLRRGYVELEESSPVFDMAATIHGLGREFDTGSTVRDYGWKDHCGDIAAGPTWRRAHHQFPLGYCQAPSAQHIRSAEGDNLDRPQ